MSRPKFPYPARPTFQAVVKRARLFPPFLRATIAEPIGVGEKAFPRGLTGSVAFIAGKDVLYFAADDTGHPVIYTPVTKDNLHKFHIPEVGLFNQ